MLPKPRIAEYPSVSPKERDLQSARYRRYRAKQLLDEAVTLEEQANRLENRWRA